MNDAVIRAIKAALANAEDNLYRAQLQKQSMSDWRSGNGESIDNIIASYQKQVDQLKDSLRMVQ